MYNLLENVPCQTKSNLADSTMNSLLSSMRPDEIIGLVERQLHFFGDTTRQDKELLNEALPPCLLRLAICFSRLKNEYFRYEGQLSFNPFHSGQYCCFLAFLRDHIKKQPTGTDLADKLYLLNKMLNGLDIYSAIMPDAIFFEHPVGTVFGRATIGNGCMVNQKVTLGGTVRKDGSGYCYPVLKEHVLLFSNAQIFGSVTVGEFSVIAMNATVVSEDIPPHSLVFGSSPNLTIKPLSLERFCQLSPFVVFS